MDVSWGKEAPVSWTNLEEVIGMYDSYTFSQRCDYIPSVANVSMLALSDNVVICSSQFEVGLFLRVPVAPTLH